MKDTPTDELLYEVKGQVGVVTFNRPSAHNALTFEMYDRLGEICGHHPGRPSVRALIITGAGGQAPSAPAPTSRCSATSARRRTASTTRRAWKPCSPSSSAAPCRRSPPSPASAPAVRRSSPRRATCRHRHAQLQIRLSYRPHARQLPLRGQHRPRGAASRRGPRRRHADDDAADRGARKHSRSGSSASCSIRPKR